ncbi:MAG: putative S-layer protein [Candidatus Nanoarchaeia archaeon]|nr:putative S-layer protein [Candidatus Nanoarchaeia archaeon]
MRKLAIMFLAVFVVLAGIASATIVNTVDANDAYVDTGIDGCTSDSCYIFYEDVTGKISLTTDFTGTIAWDLTGNPSWLSKSSAIGTTIYLTGTPSSDDYDFKGTTITVTDGNVSETYSIRVYPDFCDREDDDLKVSNSYVSIGSLDFDDDDYTIFDKVDTSIEDVNAEKEDLVDVNAQVCLYNVNSNEEIDCWSASEEIDIDEDESEDFDISFEIPNVEEIGDKKDYKLFAVIQADADDSEIPVCMFESEDINIEREKYDVSITDAFINPTSVKAGETFDVTVDFENVGSKDDDSVYVVVKENTLGLNEKSTTYDLENYDGNDNSATARFTLSVPEDAANKQYSIEVIVYFDDGDGTDSEFVMLEVKGQSTATPVVPKDSILLSAGEAVAEGNAFSLPVTVTNKAESQELSVELTNLDDWATAGSAKTQLLDKDQSTTFYFYITPNEGITGTRTATINVRSESGNILKTQSVSLKLGEEVVEEDVNVSGGIKDFFSNNSKVLWIIGDIVLIILAVVLLKFLFTKKKK